MAGLVTENPVIRRSLADSIYRLLDSFSTQDMEHYLKERGIPWEWGADAASGPWEDQWSEPDIEKGEDELDDAVSKMLEESLGSRTAEHYVEDGGQRSVSNLTLDRVQNEPTTVTATKRRSLPPIEEVIAVQVPREGTVQVGQSHQTRPSGGFERVVSPNERTRGVGSRGRTARGGTCLPFGNRTGQEARLSKLERRMDFRTKPRSGSRYTIGGSQRRGLIHRGKIHHGKRRAFPMVEERIRSRTFTSGSLRTLSSVRS